MSNTPLPVESIRPLVWEAVDALLALVEYARNSDSGIFDVLCPERHHELGLILPSDPPGRNLSVALIRQEVGRRRDQARELLEAFWRAARALSSVIPQATVDFLVASAPLPVSWAGITEPSPIRWLVRVYLAVMDLLNRTAPLLQDQQPGDATEVAARQAQHWGQIRDELAVISLPPSEELRSALEQAIACAADRQRQEVRLVEAIKEARPASGAMTLPPCGADKPVWNKDRKELWFQGKLVKSYAKKRAKNQEAVLGAFQDEGWPDRVDDPVDPGKLANTIQSLKESVAHSGLEFKRDGTSEGITWSFQQLTS